MTPGADAMRAAQPQRGSARHMLDEGLCARNKPAVGVAHMKARHGLFALQALRQLRVRRRDVDEAERIGALLPGVVGNLRPAQRT